MTTTTQQYVTMDEEARREARLSYMESATAAMGPESRYHWEMGPAAWMRHAFADVAILGGVDPKVAGVAWTRAYMRR